MTSMIKHFSDGILVLKDGSDTPVTLEIPFTEGDFEIRGLNQTRGETIAYEARGVLVGLRNVPPRHPTGSFSCRITDYSDVTNHTVLAFWKRTGLYCANVSTNAIENNLHTVNLVFNVEGTNFGDADHTITLEKCSLNILKGDLKSLSVRFEVHGTTSMT